MALTPEQLAAFSGGAQQTQPTGPTGKEGLGKTIANTFKNILPSVGKQFVNLAKLASPKNDIAIAKGLGQEVIGAFSPQHAGGDLAAPVSTDAQAAQSVQSGVPATVPIPQNKNVQAFNQFGDNFLGGALGGKGLTGLKQKLESDPAGLALDLSMLADGAGSAIQAVGDAAGPARAATEAVDATDTADAIPASPEVPNIVSRVGSTIQDVGHAINPISAPFNAVGGILGKLGSPSQSLNTDAISSANEFGVKLPIEAQVGPSAVSTVTNFIKTGPFGKALDEATSTAKNQLQDIADTTAKKISDAPDSPTLGTELKSGLQDFQDTFNNTKDDLYNKFTDEYGQTTATINNTKSAIQQLLQRYANDATPESQRIANTLQKTLDNLQYGKGQARAIIQNLRTNGYPEDMIQKVTAQAYEPTFNVLKATRTSIGNMLDKNPELASVYDALDKDRTASLENVSSEAAAKIKDIDAAYSKHMAQMGTKAVSMIQNSSPEQLVDSLIKGNNSTTLNTLKQIVPAETFNGLGLAWMKQSLANATDSVTGKLNVGSFIKNLNSIDEPTKNALFSPEQRSAINETLDQLQRVKTAQDAIDHATAGGSFLRNSMTIRGMSALPMLALGGSSYLLKFLMADLGGEFLTSKMLNSKLGQSLLTTGNSAVEGTGTALKTAGNVASKASQVRNLKP